MESLDQLLFVDTKESDLDYYGHAFHRNLGIIDKVEQERLRNACVAIPGMGGIGSAALAALARTGIGKFRIADFREYRLSNSNEQYGAASQTIGRNKAEVMAEIVTSINPEAMITLFREPVTDFNINEFLNGADLVIDGLDFFMPDTRSLLYRKARELGLNVVLTTQIGFTVTQHVFTPGTMPFDDYFQFKGGMRYEDKMLHFLHGLTPGGMYKNYLDAGYINIPQKQIPGLGITCHIASGMAATEAVSILLDRKVVKGAPYYANFNAYLTRYKNGYLWLGNRNPLQRIKIFISKNSESIDAVKRRIRKVRRILKGRFAKAPQKKINIEI